MSFIVGEIPFIEGFLRREYTRNMKDGQGEFYPCMIYGVRAVKGVSLQLQCALTGKYGGAQFLAPIQGFCWKKNPAPGKDYDVTEIDMTYVQPWDVFSSTFGVHEFSFLRKMKCLILPEKRGARYHCTLDFAGNDLSEFDEQHKFLHIVKGDDGQIGAFPNNRLLFDDPAFWDVTKDRPDFVALGGEFLAE